MANHLFSRFGKTFLAHEPCHGFEVPLRHVHMILHVLIDRRSSEGLGSGFALLFLHGILPGLRRLLVLVRGADSPVKQ